MIDILDALFLLAAGIASVELIILMRSISKDTRKLIKRH